MVNIVMIARDRYRLTKQALESLNFNSSPGSFNLTFVDDDSTDQTYPDEISNRPDENEVSILRVSNSGHNLGALKNLGVYWSERRFGRGDWLAIFDNDIAIIDPHWMHKVGRMILNDTRIGIIGGYRHPYHQGMPIQNWRVIATDAVAGYSHFMAWDVWDKFGPYPKTGGAGINKSEDFALCQKVSASGLRVGYIDPPVLVHTGVTNSEGKPAVGSEQFLRVPGVLYL